MNEAAIANRNTHVRRSAADCLKKHQVTWLDLVQIDPQSLVELCSDFPGERRSVAGEHKLDKSAAIEARWIAAAIAVGGTEKL